MIKAINLSKSFGEQELFNSVNFAIGTGERAGLIGRNGHGKTTLLRIITGEDHPDSGEISRPRGYTLGFVRQHIGFSGSTIIEEACSGLPVHMKDEKWRAEKILAGLGFSQSDFLRHPSEFSGGFQVRLNLASVLVSEPDMLLLDEPTNYLDVVSIRWLSSFLRQWKGELLLITHDRHFMDSVITHVLGIHRQKIRKMAGSTEKYYEQIVKEEEIYEKTRLNDEKKRKETELFITRFRAKARLAGMVQSRIKALDRMEKMDRLDKIKSLDFSFSYLPSQSKTALHVKDLTFGYADIPLIKDLTFSVSRTDRICVIGKNGKGKSTLLKLLAGALSPRSGELLFHPDTAIGYYAQTNVSTLNEKLTIEEEICTAGCEKQQARNIAGAMMFEGDAALKPVSVLSGGEKSRVMLGKILVSPSNLLLLDEPTNHLDMDSCDAFLAAVDDFDGACIVVTHNEMFLHSLANRFIVFGETGITVFEGTYSQFLEKIGWEDEAVRDGGRQKNSGQPGRKETRKLKANLLKRKTSELKPLEESIDRIESDIILNEERTEKITEEILALSQQGNGNGEAIASLSRELHSLKHRNACLYEELDAVTREQGRLSALFDSELEALDQP